MCIHSHQYIGCFFAEISAVQDEPDLFKPVLDDFIDHECELGYIRNRSGVLIIARTLQRSSTKSYIFAPVSAIFH